MSIHWDNAGKRYVVRFRDSRGINRAVTVNRRNLAKYGQHAPDRITVRVAKRLEQVPNVLLNDSHRPWNRNSLNSALRRFRAAKYFPLDWNVQMLRATYGSLLVQQGVPIAHVSMALGHADARITQTWYIGLKSTHVAPEISNAINRALS